MMKEYKLITACGFREDGSSYQVEMKYQINAASMEEMWNGAVGQVTGDPSSKELEEAFRLIQQEAADQFGAEKKVKVGASHGKKRKIGE